MNKKVSGIVPGAFLAYKMKISLYIKCRLRSDLSKFHICYYYNVNRNCREHNWKNAYRSGRTSEYEKWGIWI